MREFTREPYLMPEARRVYDGLNGIHQADVERRVDFLCQHPEPDDEITFAWPEEGPNVFILYDGAWVITYALADDGNFIEIWSLAPVGWLNTDT